MDPTILIVDDHAGFLAEARQLLEAEGLQVIGEAVDGRSAIDAASSNPPDLALIDVSLPDTDGFALARQIAIVAPKTRVILISSRDRATYGSRVDDAPVIGFIHKEQLSGAAIRGLVGVEGT